MGCREPGIADEHAASCFNVDGQYESVAGFVDARIWQSMAGHRPLRRAGETHVGNAAEC